MSSSFDAILVGAGPAAIAALSAMPPGLRLAIITGAASSPPQKGAKPHPKVSSVAFEYREEPGLTDFLPNSSANGPGLFSTASVGGLANYWGQQFVRYSANDSWPDDIFDRYSDYAQACKQVEAMFRLSPAPVSECERADDATIIDGYSFRTPRLLIGTDVEPNSGLLAMRKKFQDLVTSLNLETIASRAVSWTVERSNVCVRLSNGETVKGRKLILAAGVVGTLRCILAACSEISAVRFSDHAPYMLYTWGLGRLVRVERTDGLRHFNALTIERLEGDRSQLFASVYRMRHAPLSLLLAVSGLPPMLRGWFAPSSADLIKPIQVWTETAKCQYRIDRDAGNLTLRDAPAADDDETLRNFLVWLKHHLVTLKVAAARGGFHYHAGEVTADGITYVPVRTFLEERFGDQVTCVDATVLKTVGCRPHSLTSMAAAYNLSRQVQQ
ncbi:MAG TPA: hypothetical protein VFW22_15740 [Pseudolabrys sp.]|nr:hypothetical protein [Pseudolabrys sp.]